MSKSQRGLLNLAVLLVIAAVIIIFVGLAASSWGQVIPLIIAFYGCWFIAFAGIRNRYQSKYSRSAFSTLGWGMLLAAIGFGSDLNVIGLISWIYTVAVVILLLGILGLVAALRTPRKPT
jgi:cbb3-type cytochrome oxidase subunit 3